MERRSSISEIPKIISETLHKERQKGIISIGNVFSRILRKYKKFQRLAEIHQQNQSVEQQKQIEEELKDIKDEIYNHLSEEVLSIYPDGLKSLLPEAVKPEDNQVYVVLEFEGPNGFYDKYYGSGIKKEEEKESQMDYLNENDIQLEYLTDHSFISKKNIQFKDLLEEINSRKKQTREYIKLLNAIYLDTDQFDKILLEKVIIHFAEIKSKEFIINEPKKYNIIKQNLSKFILSDEQEQEYKFVSNLFSQYIFFEFKYEDFILIFLRLTKFMTGLSGFIEIDEINNIFVKFFCLEENFYQLAELYKIKLQLKPYAYYYDQLSIRIDYNPNTTNEDDIRLLFHADSKNLSQQFSEMNQDDQLLFPPYETFSANKKIKFRRYTLNNDNLHNCPLDPELSSLNKPDADRKMENNELDISDNDLKQQCCSIFRGIDKLRMITNTFGDKKLLYLKKFGRLKSIILLRNYKGYEIDNQ